MRAVAEVEAKLLVPELSSLDAIARLERAGAFRLVPRRRARLHTVYLDTADFGLLRAGVCLRVRRDGRRFEATAKWMGEVRGTIHARPELTVALDRAPGRRFALPEGPLREKLCALVAGRPLEPILVTDIDRHIVDVLPDGARRAARERSAAFAELALDRVRVAAPRAPGHVGAEYGELEIELRHGTRAELASLARWVRREFDLTPTRDTKFSRGLRLLYGNDVLGARAAALPGAADTLQDAARKVLGLQLARMREYDPETRRAEDPEALHQLRVAVRKARAALRALGAGIPSPLRDRLEAELRWFSGVMGAVRDLDVQLEAHTPAPRAASAAERRAIALLRAYLQQERASARAELARALDSRRYLSLLVALEDFADGRTRGATSRAARAPLTRAGCAELDRAMEVVRRRGRKLAGRTRPPSAEELHALRIRAKRARYLLEFMSELTGKPGRRVEKRLARLQQRLGEHQDAVVAAEWIRRYVERPGTRVRADTQRALHALIARQEHRAERARARFHAAWREFARERAQRDLRKALLRMQAPAALPSSAPVSARRSRP